MGKTVALRLVLASLCGWTAACGSATGGFHAAVDANSFPFAVVSAESVQPEQITRLLIERGYRVATASPSNVRTLRVDPKTVLFVDCRYLGHTGNVLTGTSSNVSCSASDLSTGEAIYSGTGKHMGVLTEEEDTRGAISKALAALPRMGRQGSITQLSNIPRTATAAAATPLPPSAGVPRIATTGTGFFVDGRGYLLTNAHVVAQCSAVRVRSTNSPLEITRVDTENDLAVLKQANPVSKTATFREGRGIRPGDGVVAVGYPLTGLLASEANVTTGAVSALAGLGDDFRFLQITAPVQPGNSGGPLLDMSGRIVGVVASKLNALQLARVTGDIPQNVNFAVNASVARILLDAVGIQYETAAAENTLQASDIGVAAKEFTVLLECWR
jgi:S1-C subfamily serine protease